MAYGRSKSGKSKCNGPPGIELFSTLSWLQFEIHGLVGTTKGHSQGQSLFWSCLPSSYSPQSSLAFPHQPTHLRWCVAASLSASHCFNFSSSLTRNPSLNFFGSIDNPVGLALHSRGPVKMGSSAGFRGANTSNAHTILTNVMYSSRFARCDPVHMRDPAPYAKCCVPCPSARLRNRSGMNSVGESN